MYGTFAGGGPKGDVVDAYGSNNGGGATDPGGGAVGASDGAGMPGVVPNVEGAVEPNGAGVE